jgi:hypothetical protein
MVISEHKPIQGVPGGRVILGKKVYMYVFSILNGFRDRGISLYNTLYRRATRNVLTRVAKCIGVDGGFLKMYYTR